MKHIYKSAFLAIGTLLMLSSCEEFLDREPIDSLSDTEYWLNDDHCRTYAYGFYPSYFIGYGTTKLISASEFGLGDTFNDDIAWDSQSDFTPIRIPDTDASYTYSYARRANYMLEKVTEMTSLTEEEQNHWMGVARFFRALEYCDLTWAYGDVVWYDHRVEATDKDDMFRDRDPRAEVMRHVMEDFQFAMDNCKESDGANLINKYVAAAYASRRCLEEGTFEKYHNVDNSVADDLLKMARDAALMVMNSGLYTIVGDYNSIFSSEDLSSNNEVILYREYADGVLVHDVLAYNNMESQTGINKALAEAYLMSNGLPVHCDESWMPRTDEDFFADRDGRLTCSFRSEYYIRGEDCTPFNFSTSGYSMRKFMDESKAGDSSQQYVKEMNTTDCPLIRLGEVLLNYAEARYELGELTQNDLDISINLLRRRSSTSMPDLQIVGSQPAVSGQVYDDPMRDQDVPSLLWELRRERRVELAFEGHRYRDLKRWKKFDYMYNGTNPDIRYGAYIIASNYPKRDTSNVAFEDESATEGYILCNRNLARSAPLDRNYVKPVPKDQIQLYKDNGYTLTQTKEWLDAE